MKKIIKTPNAPLPIGPYNQAVIANNTLYISGQVAINPANNEVVSGEIEVETKQVMENLKAILEEAGLTFENVVKASVFVKDMHLFSRINAVYTQYFNEATAPARELVEVVNLPKFVNIEISMIATMGA
jgi:2-iminobutanoate/2-iminopropanoate deaminase